MTALAAGTPFPKTELSKVGGGTVTLGEPQDGHKWQIVVIYRGLHCPKCKDYLAILDGLQAKYHAAGIDVVVASSDPLGKAKAMSDEYAPRLPMGFDMTPAQMAALGLYISDPRDTDENDRPFAEPGMFVINPDGLIQMVDVSNVPFMRPDLEAVLAGIEFHRSKKFPIRGRHKAA
jgi:peroxiredoxin